MKKTTNISHFDVDNSFTDLRPLMQRALPYKRLLDRDGHFQIHKEGLSFLTLWTADFYHYICNLSWWRVLLSSFVFFMCCNIVFGSLYFIDLKHIGNTSVNSTWLDSFFFSVQTMGTIGYGYYYPNSVYLNSVVTFQCWFSIVINAILTGLIITKIQRPARLRYTIEFSKVAVINNLIPSFTMDNKDWCPTGEYKSGNMVFAFRIFNLRKRLLCMPDLRLFLLHKTPKDSFLITEMDYDINNQVGRPRGDCMSKPHLQLPWTVVHKIDVLSPLYSKSLQEMIEEQFEIICVLDGVDELTSLNFQCRWSFLPTEIRWNHDFFPMLSRNDEGEFVANYNNLSRTCPVEDFVSE